uniref:Cytochrome c oxidase subunit 5B, mitochondrial n=1 Tax=Syphacia muris TaxID=451379 RepID=A0A0N5ALS6_9BILA
MLMLATEKFDNVQSTNYSNLLQRYEPKIYYRAVDSSREFPNLVPSHFEDRVIGCLCEPDSYHINYMIIRKGPPKRCECGHWFKLVDADPDSI